MVAVIDPVPGSTTDTVLLFSLATYSNGVVDALAGDAALSPARAAATGSNASQQNHASNGRPGA